MVVVFVICLVFFEWYFFDGVLRFVFVDGMVEFGLMIGIVDEILLLLLERIVMVVVLDIRILLLKEYEMGVELFEIGMCRWWFVLLLCVDVVVGCVVV